MPVWIAPNGYFIEHAGANDAAPMAKIHAQNFYRGWSEAEFDAYIVQKNIFTYVVRKNTKKIAGMLIMRQAGDEAEVLSIAITRKWRKKGFAHALLNAGTDEVARFGVRKLFLEVNQDNVGALKLYARHGFITVAKREQYYQDPQGNPATALVMRRDLG